MRDTKPIDAGMLLARTPLFTGLDPDRLARIAAATRVVRAGRGRRLFRQGEPCRGLHLVLHGQFKVSLIAPRGGEKVLGIVGQGKSYGEAFLFLNRPYSVFGQAINDTDLLHVSGKALLREMSRDPGLCIRMLGSLAAHQYELLGEVESFSLQSGMERIVNFLLREIPETGEGAEEARICLAVPRYVIASRLGMTQEYFSRLVNDLDRRELISIQGREIGIPSVGRLRRLLR